MCVKQELTTAISFFVIQEPECKDGTELRSQHFCLISFSGESLSHNPDSYTHSHRSLAKTRAHSHTCVLHLSLLSLTHNLTGVCKVLFAAVLYLLNQSRTDSGLLFHLITGRRSYIMAIYMSGEIVGTSPQM